MRTLNSRINAYKWVLGKIYQQYLQQSPSPSSLWKMHPEGDYFIERGGNNIPPPLSCNIILTNICNLKCSICGNQSITDIKRRSMGIDIFRTLAETLFPVLTAVELNSEGEPLIYPHFEEVLETIKKFGCRLILQSNATLLNSKIIDLLCEQDGEMSFSVDATGRLFDLTRRGGSWKVVDSNIRELMKKRNPEKLIVQITPVVTERTLPDMLNVLEWSYELGVDKVIFRRYEPICNSQEIRPSDNSMLTQIKQVKRWVQKHPKAPFVSIDAKRLSWHIEPCFSTPDGKRGLVYANYPQTWFVGHPNYVCPSPIQYVDIDIEGNISACCRTQTVKLGSAVTIQDFAKAWFGNTYQEIRNALLRGSSTPNPSKECAACIQNYL
jgi:MoaA/NifB/PqqE/SkfB family radical SAM enzyme